MLLGLIPALRQIKLHTFSLWFCQPTFVMSHRLVKMLLSQGDFQTPLWINLTLARSECTAGKTLTDTLGPE